MGKPLGEVQDLLDELNDWKDQAAADPAAAGRGLRQQIIDRATDLASSSGDLAPVAPEDSERDVIEHYISEGRRVKAEAEDIRLWALHNLPIDT
jgi:hypothetical protein